MRYKLFGQTALFLPFGALALFAACGDSGSSSSTGTSQSSSSSSGAGGEGMAGSGGTNTGGGNTGGNSGTGGSGGSGGGSANACSGPRMDIVFEIDNSRSMADKQEVLSLVVAKLVESLAHPPCVDATGTPIPNQPADPSFCDCPAGSSRLHAPITDMHIGVISSSIGGHGSDACAASEIFTCNGQPNTSNNDRGHLLSRKNPCTGDVIPTYENQGFLNWDPLKQSMPAGTDDMVALGNSFKDMVLGVGQIGCGYESQLEAWYRFLVDPEPYDTISMANGIFVPAGTDQALLQQRADFLRPDSVLAIFMLTDENDCSTKEFGQFPYVNQLKNANGTVFHLPRPRAECAVDPNDPCCRSCGQPPGNCPADPSCLDGNGNVIALTDAEDPTNLRCFEQKRRFGIDFMYPIDRYTAGLTQPMVPDRSGQLVNNPIYSDLNLGDNIKDIRTPDKVFMTGIVGVPWQLIARNPAMPELGVKDAAELLVPDGNGETGWDQILGDPANYIPPKDMHMVESINPRPGLAPPNSPANADPIHGHEYTSVQQSDLQFACIFPLKQPKDCTVMGTIGCECTNPNNDSPLCNPNNKFEQVNAKAYPGLRELSLLKSLGDRGVVGSICPVQASDDTSPTYAYLPVWTAFIERAKGVLGQP